MAVTAQMVKALRERTGAGMMECKKALTAANGDIEQAVEEMRKSGLAKADKKASRTAAEGIIAMKKGQSHALMVEINSETDFVARDDNFKQFTDMIVQVAFDNDLHDRDALLNHTLESGETIEEARKVLVAKIGENIDVRRVACVHGPTLGAYSHGGTIGVVVALEGGDEALAKDVAMHIAAQNPQAISQDDVPSELVEKEKALFTAQAEESGKPKEIIEKMIQGRIRKFLDEQSVLGQGFVKDPNQKVGDLLAEKNAKVLDFVRFEVGEGIEKAESDFAEEVMSQVQAQK